MQSVRELAQATALSLTQLQAVSEIRQAADQAESRTRQEHWFELKKLRPGTRDTHCVGRTELERVAIFPCLPCGLPASPRQGILNPLAARITGRRLVEEPQRRVNVFSLDEQERGLHDRGWTRRDKPFQLAEKRPRLFANVRHSLVSCASGPLSKKMGILDQYINIGCPEETWQGIQTS